MIRLTDKMINAMLTDKGAISYKVGVIVKEILGERDRNMFPSKGWQRRLFNQEVSHSQMSRLFDVFISSPDKYATPHDNIAKLEHEIKRQLEADQS